MNTPKISVILPTRLRPRLLPRAAGSVLAQTERDFELIVVDDNPPDASAATIAALAPWRSDPRLRIVTHGEGRNVAAARNAGLAVARGRWVTYLDDDDAYVPGKLAAQLALAERTGASLVLCGLRYRQGPRVRLRQCDADCFAGTDLLLRAQAAAPALFHRRDSLAVFDPSFDAAEDQELFLRLVESWALTEVPNVPEPLVDVYPQAMGSRANTPSPVLWRAQRRLCVRHAQRYGRDARRQFVARTALLQLRSRPAGAGEVWRASRRLLAVGGTGECRLIVNTWMLRLPGLRRLAVT
jgi:glycosyltransferase involved in cell wall biosynthesis